MSKDPAFLFYSSDFLVGTMTMTNEEVGIYVRLLCLQHQNGKLQNSDFNHFGIKSDSPIIQKFTLSEDGFFYNERLKLEAEKRKKHSENQRENIRKRWDKNDEISVIPNQYVGNTDVIPLENENENENVLRIKGKERGKPIKEIFQIENANFAEPWEKWKSYKKSEFRFTFKDAETERIAFEKLFKLSGGDPTKAAAIVKQSIENGWKGLFNHNQNQNHEIPSRNHQRPEPSGNIGSAGFGKL